MAVYQVGPTTVFYFAFLHHLNFFLCSVIRDMIRLEKSLDVCLERLKSRCSQLNVDADMSDTDDLDSIASGSLGARRSIVRFAGHHREVERLTQKLSKVEVENRDLRQQVRELETLLGRKSKDGGVDGEEEKAEEEKLQKEGQARPELSEGRIWGILRKIDGRTPPKSD
jgi:hypothetical protein